MSLAFSLIKLCADGPHVVMFWIMTFWITRRMSDEGACAFFVPIARHRPNRQLGQPNQIPCHLRALGARRR